MLARIHEKMLESVKHLDEQTQGLVLLAYVNYQLYEIEPSKDNLLVYSIFQAHKFMLDNTKKDINASVNNGKKGGRPSKTFKNLNKPKQNLKQPKSNLKKPKTNLNNEQVINELETGVINETKSDALLLYNNIINNNINIQDNKENITSNINNLITELKNTADELKIAYDKKDERNFCRHILTAKDYGELAEKIGQTRVEFAKSIMRASVGIKYRKGACSWPKAIYQNYVEVFNKTVELHTKQNEGIF